MAGNASAICTELETFIGARRSIITVMLFMQFSSNTLDFFFCDLSGCPVALVREVQVG